MPKWNGRIVQELAKKSKSPSYRLKTLAAKSSPTSPPTKVDQMPKTLALEAIEHATGEVAEDHGAVVHHAAVELDEVTDPQAADLSPNYSPPILP